MSPPAARPKTATPVNKIALLFAQKPGLVTGSSGSIPWSSNSGCGSGDGCVSYDDAGDSASDGVQISVSGVVGENGGVSHDAGEAAGGENDETGARSAALAVGTTAQAGVESGPESTDETALPHVLQNLTPGFNCEPQYKHSLLAGTEARSTGPARGVAHVEQNFVPGRTLAPHDGQMLAGFASSDGRDTAEPHQRQNFPATSALQLGHSMLASVSKEFNPQARLAS